jgi:hypothetical protein
MPKWWKIYRIRALQTSLAGLKAECASLEAFFYQAKKATWGEVHAISVLKRKIARCEKKLSHVHMD